MKKFTIISIFQVLSISLFAQLHGISPDWYQTPILMPKINAGWDASGAVANNMVVDKNGRVLVFYTEGDGSTLKLYYTGSSDDGQSWTAPAPTEFTPANNTIGNSTLSVDLDSAGVIHAIWSSRNSKALFYAKADANTLIWSDTLRIGQTTKSKIGFSQISTDRKKRLHVYWNESGPGSSETAEVFYSKSLDGGLSWSQQLQLSDNEARHSAFPSGDFSGASGDTLAIAWRDSVGIVSGIDQDWDVKMVQSIDGGNNWSGPFTVSGGTGMQSDPSVVLDKNGIIHIAFHEYPEFGGVLKARVYYGKSSDLGLTWNDGNFIQISTTNIQSHLVKEAYDFENDVVWYFYKDQRDYVSPFDKRADLMAVNISGGGTVISPPEFVSDADSLEVGYHNFKIGSDGIPRAHFFIIPSDGSPLNLYYTQMIDQSSGYNQLAPDKNDLFVYPNPVSETLHILGINQRAKICLYNYLGLIVMEKQLAEEEELDLGFLESGVYLLNITKIDGTSTLLCFQKK